MSQYSEIKARSFFILTCARSGSTSLSKILNEAENGVCKVEPAPNLNRETRLAMDGRLADPRDAWVRSYKNFGVVSKEGNWSFDILGSNYKISDIVAAVGLAMMDYLEDLLAKRVELAATYQSLLSGSPKVSFPTITPHGTHSWQSYPIFVENRDAVIQMMKEVNIEVQIGSHALHRHPAFQGNPLIRLQDDLSNSRYVFENCLVLPLYHEMTEEEQRYVVDSLLRFL
jgi:perosamine synthetase